MIIDNISNASMYSGINSRITLALQYLQDTDFDTVETGRHDIQGDEVYALVQDYDTKPVEKKSWEAHRCYIDVQYIVSGAERMGYTNIENLKVTKEYDGDKDILLLQGDGDFLVMKAGAFVILAPHDAHMPGVAVDGPKRVRKVVVKVKVDD